MKNSKDKNSLLWIISSVIVGIIFIVWLFFLPKFDIEDNNGAEWTELKNNFFEFLNIVGEQKEILTEEIIPMIKEEKDQVSMSEEELDKLEEKILEEQNNTNIEE